MSSRWGTVIDRDDPTSGSKRLVAYYVAPPEGAPSLRELQAFLAGQLPGYMIPAAFVRLDFLPVTPTGKTDRKALPEPIFATSWRTYHARQGSQKGSLAPAAASPSAQKAITPSSMTQ